jgi:GTPase SAR1 family protein
MPHVELPQAEFKVVMLGDTFTGKTSLVVRFVEGYFRESGRSATVGAFFVTKRYGSGVDGCWITYL